MSLLTEQEIREAYEKHSNEFLFEDTINFARAIEAKVIEKIKAQGPEVFIGQGLIPIVPEDLMKLEKYEPGMATLYDTPLYSISEGD